MVEDVEDSCDRLDDVVLTQFRVGAIARPFTAAPAIAITEPASPPALTPLAVVLAARLLGARALLIAACVLSALVGFGVLSALLAFIGIGGGCALLGA